MQGIIIAMFSLKVKIVLSGFRCCRYQGSTWKRFLAVFVVASILLLSNLLHFTTISLFVHGANFVLVDVPLAPTYASSPEILREELNRSGTRTHHQATILHPVASAPLQKVSSNWRSICRILISNRVGDFHYEILESVALQYPIEWERHSAHCHYEEQALVVIDFFLDFKYKGYSNSTEAWGWWNYFEQHLQGQIMQRHAATRNANFTKEGKPSIEDQRWIQFGKVVDATMNSTVDWNQYDILIEANCGFIGGWEKRLQQERTRSYCVLHSNYRKKVHDFQIESQVCYLNPQHAPFCWFVPSDLPKFEKSSMIPSPIVFRVCMGWKAYKNHEHRDTTLLAQTLEQLRPANVLIVVIGRNAKIPQQILQASSDLSHYILLELSHLAFYDYQRTISQCDALLPLIHPHGTSMDYFLNVTVSEENGRLSGMISQSIGNAIPTVIHSAAADIYRPLFTAPIFEYNETNDPASFINAFRHMMDHIQGQQSF